MKRPRSKSALALKLAEKAQQGRYGLLVWLRANYADLATARSELHLSFEQLAEAAAEAGIKDGQGNEPKTWTVRKFFKQVELEQLALHGERGAKPGSGAGQGGADPADAALDPPPVSLRTGRLRGHSPARQAPAAPPVARSVPAPSRADEVIGQFAGQEPPSRFSQKDDE